MIFLGGTPLGAPFIGWIGEVFGARWTLIAGGLITLVGTLLAIALFTRHTGLVVRPKFGRRPTWVVASRADIIRARVREQEVRAAANDAASN